MVTNVTVSTKKCPNCGSDMIVDNNIVLTSYPPQYKYVCPKCGEVANDWVIYNGNFNADDMTTTTTPIEQPNTCNHKFVVQVVSGELVSVCERCGKIGDRKDYYNNTTGGLGRYYGL